jgi:hypothetical protein
MEEIIPEKKPHEFLCACGHSYIDHHYKGDGSSWEPCSKCNCPHLRPPGTPIPSLLIEMEKLSEQLRKEWYEIAQKLKQGIIFQAGTDMVITGGCRVQLIEVTVESYDIGDKNSLRQSAAESFGQPGWSLGRHSEFYLEFWDPFHHKLLGKIKIE